MSDTPNEKETADGPRCDGSGAARGCDGSGAARVAGLIDHTLLKPEATTEQIERLCREGVEYRFATVCVNPPYVATAARLLDGTSVRVCAVAGFPLGAHLSEIKVAEARRALVDGAREIDMVINVGAMKDGDLDRVHRDIAGVVDACREGGAICKVIIECALLTDEEKVQACRTAVRAGADFVKTSTGFSTGGATVEDVRLMREAVRDRQVGVKAAGGIRNYADFLRMIEAGATRIGTSSGVGIVKEARGPASGD